jgi:hypothetical protein
LARASWIVHPTEPERTRARALAEDALRSYGQATHVHATEVDEVRQWLDEHPLR